MFNPPTPGLPRRLIWVLFCICLSFLLHASVDNRALLTWINQRPIGVELRLTWWNWRDTPEEISCFAAHNLSSKAAIPNIVHFVLLAKEGEVTNLSYAQFLAVKSAILQSGAREVKIHTNGLEKDNTWFQKLANHTTVVPIDPDMLRPPPGFSLKDLRLEHQADILRLEILRREGGIYLDTDVYVLKSFANLLTNQRDAVLAHEGGNRYGLCNAVILARADSKFIRLWQETYEQFDPGRWNFHSVRIPKRLQSTRQYSHLVCPLSPTVFFWPTWATMHLQHMYEPISIDESDDLQADMSAFDGAMYNNQLAFHATSASKYLSKLSLQDIQTRNTRFNILIRDIATAPL